MSKDDYHDIDTVKDLNNRKFNLKFIRKNILYNYKMRKYG